MSDKLVTEAATYTAHDKHRRRKFMPSAGFKPTIAAGERPQTYASDRGHRDGQNNRSITQYTFFSLRVLHINLL